MKLTFADDRVLAVLAHPDDAELLCAGALARAREDRAAVGVCVMCNGDKGVRSGERVANLGEVRRGEAQEAAKLLGATLYWYDCPDGELFDTYENRRGLIEVYRQFRPTLVITHPGEDYHPDHRATAALAEAASWFCASSGHVTGSAAVAAPPAVWFTDTLNGDGFVPEFHVDVSGQMALKKQMLACHRSQLARGQDANFSPLMELMLRQARGRGAQAGAEYAESFRVHKAFKRQRAW